MNKQDLITDIARAISKMEGFYVRNSLASKNNNPGNLRSWAGVPSANGFAKFPKAEAGWKALYQQIESNIFGKGKRDSFPLRAAEGLSMREFFAGQRDKDGNVLKGGYPGYAPAADKNQPEHYAKFVASEAGVPDIDVKLKSLIK